jgi:ABC-2 type transport system permease protein
MRAMLRLYFRLIGAQIRSEMQYRASLVAETVGAFAITALDFVAIVILLGRFQEIDGWTLPEVAFLYGVSTISFSIAELNAGGYDYFEQMVVRGDFDRLLVRPLGTVFQMLTEAWPLRRFGRLAQGVIAFGFAMTLLRPEWDAFHWVFLAVTICGGALLFFAIFVIGATACFWTPQTSELTNVFSYGGQFMTSYPMSIYERWMRAFFTFVIPMAFINYYPSLYLLDKPDPFGLPAWMPFLSPFVAVIVLLSALAIWRFGVSHYQSTGS